jgi:hypothetical protein
MQQDVVHTTQDQCNGAHQACYQALARAKQGAPCPHKRLRPAQLALQFTGTVCMHTSQAALHQGGERTLCCRVYAALCGPVFVHMRPSSDRAHLLAAWPLLVLLLGPSPASSSREAPSPVPWRISSREQAAAAIQQAP